MAVYESGVHATIAGVVLGLLTPARPMQTELEADEIVDVLENRPDLHADDVRATATLIRGSVSACDRLIDALHPWTSYVIVPIFALANAGIVLSSDTSRRSVRRARRRRRRPGGRQARRCRLVQLARRAARPGSTPRRSTVGSRRRCRRRRRDRLHRVVVHHRAGLRVARTRKTMPRLASSSPLSSRPLSVPLSSVSPAAAPPANTETESERTVAHLSRVTQGGSLGAPVKWHSQVGEIVDAITDPLEQADLGRLLGM